LGRGWRSQGRSCQSPTLAIGFDENAIVILGPNGA
jgi:hypothetical protein